MRYLILGLLLLAGCQEKMETSKDNHSPCTVEQLGMVSKYMEICEGTNYYKSYCFDMAVRDYCIAKKEGNNDTK